MLRARDEQLELAGELLHRARHGRGGSLAVVAEPGLGRTALLESVVRDASADFHVVGVRGIRAETELVGAALHRVLGNRETNPYAVHRLLVESARRRPLLCWADDAHWLDRASLAALAFVARRVRDEPLVMMFSAADEPPEALAGIRTLRLPRLDRPASLEVLADHAADGMPPD
ncbi:MAG: ATP-binding protein, partial [Streptosporangiaceae bacterium]